MTFNTPNIVWSNEIDNPIKKNITIGLDRDGVINVDQGTYVTDPDQFIPLPGSLEAIASIRANGYNIAIITNQGGIEKGLMSVEDVEKVHNKLLSMLGEAGCQSIDAIYYSASSKRNDMYAKPNTGMFKKCERENPQINFSTGYFVGDKISDLKSALKMNTAPVLVRTGYGKTTEDLINSRSSYKTLKKKTIVFDDLFHFSKWLLK